MTRKSFAYTTSVLQFWILIGIIWKSLNILEQYNNPNVSTTVPYKYTVDAEYLSQGQTRVCEQDLEVKGHNFKIKRSELRHLFIWPLMFKMTFRL